MTRFKLTAYIIDFIGVLLTAFSGVGRFIKDSHTHQVETGYKPKISVEEGSFWLTANTDPFLFPGIALLAIGTAMVYYDIMKTMRAKNTA